MGPRYKGCIDEQIEARQQECVFPVAKDDALKWFIGRMEDNALLFQSPLRPEAVFLVNLPGIECYSACLEKIAYWKSQGALFMIARTANSIVAKHILKKNPDCKIMHHEPGGACRFLVPPHAFDRWVKSWS